MRYRKRPEFVDAITFEEFITYGKMHADSMVNGVPWSFEYKGHRVTHETDNCYLLPPNGATKYPSVCVPGDMIVTNEYGDIYAMNANEFYALYEACE